MHFRLVGTFLLIAQHPLRSIVCSRRSRSMCIATENERPLPDEKNNEVAYSQVKETLEQLDGKTSEMASLSEAEILSVAQELLENCRLRESEWANAGDWIFEEMELTKIWAAPEDRENCRIPGYAIQNAALVRGSLCQMFVGWLEHFIRGAKSRVDNKQDRIVISASHETVKSGIIKRYNMGMLSIYPMTKVETWTTPAGEPYTDDERYGCGPFTTSKPCLVLGAGNQSILPMIDVLHVCLVRRVPALLKHHPIRSYLAPVFDILFEPLIKRGYFAHINDHGIEFTKSILDNPIVGHVHITGAKTTSDAVKKALAATRTSMSIVEIDKMVTDELGCATPLIVTPGKYTKWEMTNAAYNFTTSRKMFGGANCCSNQVLILPKDWPQKDEFRKIFMKAVKNTRKDPTYYPGSLHKRRSSVQAAGSSRSKLIKSKLPFKVDANSRLAEDHHNEDDEVAVVECGTPGEESFYKEALLNEAFCPLVAVVELPGGGPDDPTYMTDTLVSFLNDKSNIYGSLSCGLVKPSSVPLPKDAIAALNYGCVCVNLPSIMAYIGGVCGGVWGGHPNDVSGQSGRGYNGNPYHIDRVDKAVVYGPPLNLVPLLDKRLLPPSIAFDAFHTICASRSAWRASLRVTALLAVRGLQAPIPNSVLRTLFGSKAARPYGSAFH